MTGTILNGAAILIGGVAGLTVSKQLSLPRQKALKVFLGAFTVYAGLSMTWSALNGPFFQICKQFIIVLLALMLGKLTGQLLRLQRALNHLGKYAKQRFSQTTPNSPHRMSEGFITCTLLFCVGPMAILGSVQDGLTGNFKTLAIKSVMDGLATMAFVTTFGWGVILSVVPVVAYQGTITLAARSLSPFLQNQALLDSVNATGGFLVFCIALIILELKKIELADYLPSLVLAPLLTWVWR